jgi:ABC-type transport system involved in multi-copper enzyme maturation permease subunit
MTAITSSGQLDVTGTPPVPFGRLVTVELRKMGDTRAGKWLLIVIGLITVLIVGLLAFVGDSDDHTFGNFLGATATPQGFLLPVLGVLLVTSEWSQRATLTTFTLVPHRGRILVAKIVAAVLFGLAAIVVAMLASAVATLLSNASDPWGSFGTEDIAKVALLQTLGVLQGVAFGMLFLNSAAAIVTYFVLPIGFNIVTSAIPALHDVQPWIDPGTAQMQLFGGGWLTGEEWAQLATTTLLWIGLPLALGAVRMMRAEVK